MSVSQVYGVLFKGLFSILFLCCEGESDADSDCDVLLGAFGAYATALRSVIDFSLQLTSSRVAEVPVPRGVIVYGPSGTGKSTLVRVLLKKLQVHSFTLSPTEIWSHLYGEAESKLNAIIDEAIKQ